MIGKNFFDFMLDKGNFVNPKTKTLTSIRLIGLNTTTHFQFLTTTTKCTFGLPI